MLGILKLKEGEKGSSIQSRVAFDKYAAEVESITKFSLSHMSFSLAPSVFDKPTVKPLQPPPLTSTLKYSASDRVWSIFFSAAGVISIHRGACNIRSILVDRC